MMLFNDKKLAALLGSISSIAVVGAVDKPGRPVDNVGRQLIEWGYDVIPVHPKRQNVWGLQTYTALSEIPRPVDAVDLFRAAQFCPDHARETLNLDPLPKIFWMQSGIISPEAAGILSATDMTVVEDRCLMVEIQRMLGKEYRS